MEFALVGFADASMDAIAARAGATKPTLYARFGSKHDLYVACLEHEYESLTAWLFAAYAQGSSIGGREAIRIAMRASFDYAVARPHGFGLLLDARSDEATGYRDKLIDVVTARLVTDVEARLEHHGQTALIEHAGSIASMLVGQAVFAVQYALRHGSADVTAAVELSTEFAWSGIGGLSSSSR